VLVGLGVGVVSGATHAETCIQVCAVDPAGIAGTWITSCG
jgi:hypothetical protein